MEKAFKGTYRPFYSRLFKKMSPAVILVLAAAINVLYGSSDTFKPYKFHILVLLAVCFVIGVFYQASRIRIVVSPVRLSDAYFRISGFDYNTKFNEDLDLDKTFLEVIEEKIGTNDSICCLEIRCGEQFYYLNKASDWSYGTLREIMAEYEQKTGRLVQTASYWKTVKRFPE